jgi:hypothetical protein
MNEFGDGSNDLEAEIFFRSTDRLQMDSCLKAMAHDGKSLVIYSPVSELLDHYGRAFVRRLRSELTDTPVEVFMPPDTEAMLDKFNHLLGTIKLDVAIKPRVGLSPSKIWVVHEANVLSAHELDLFTRLIHQFPGAGVAAILMFSSGQNLSQSIMGQGRQFVSWTLELPTAAQKLSTIQQARKSGREELVTNFFNKLSRASAKRPADDDNKTKAPEDRTKKSTPQKKSKTKNPKWLWVLIAGSLLIFSLAVTAMLHPDKGHEVLSGLSGWVDQLMTDPQKPEKSVSKQLPPEDAPPGPPSILPVNQSEATSTANVSPTPEPAALGASSAPNASRLSSTATAPQPKEPVKVITELPEAAVQGRLWLKGLPSESFVIEHKQFASLKDAQTAIKGKDWLVNARIVPVFAEGKDEAQFAVVTGPFKSKERAKNASVRLGLSSDAAIIAVPAAQVQAVPNKAKP